jgi:hypothetical protein
MPLGSSIKNLGPMGSGGGGAPHASVAGKMSSKLKSMVSPVRMRASRLKALTLSKKAKNKK